VKVDIVRDCLRRIARVDFQGDIPITPSPNAWQYRSSAQWRFNPAKNHFGYFERGSHTVCDVAECPILVPSLQNLLVTLRGRMKEGKLSPDSREFEAVAGDDDVSIMQPFEPDEKRDVSRNIGGDHYVFSADGFFQINHELLPALIELATQHANGETAFDLYCGAGLFTLPLSRRFQRVIGVESNAAAVTYARRNLAEAKLNNAVIECSTVGDWLHANGDSNAPVDFILLDPPRAGVEKGVVEEILALRPRQITYVSCDPATLARDLRGLIDGGFSLDSVVAFDMFPQTHHVETVVRLSHTFLNDGL
jgi:23S rRNA (uracil1939-C5)-methyltransferase